MVDDTGLTPGEWHRLHSPGTLAQLERKVVELESQNAELRQRIDALFRAVGTLTKTLKDRTADS